MELKLAVPHGDVGTKGTFNRTSMELKRGCEDFYFILKVNPFNRTSMELKLKCKENIQTTTRIATFNRTSMELKLDITLRLTLRPSILLIEPVWN